MHDVPVAQITIMSKINIVLCRIIIVILQPKMILNEAMEFCMQQIGVNIHQANYRDLLHFQLAIKIMRKSGHCIQALIIP